MASFDFITDEKFRTSLESDYREIEAALAAKAWKAAHVLAGSIIEAVLADYLQDVGYHEEQRALNPKANDASIDPLKMSLGALIEACKAKGILTERSVALSSVVQGYRNLIHPGRVIRLEETVDENTATVAKALVEIIVGEVANKRRETFGLTAVQVVKKVIQDPDSVAFIEHLLRGMSSSELEHLLVYELPDTYLEELESARQVSEYDEYRPSMSFKALKPTFRDAYERANDAIRAKVVRRFVTILKEESRQIVTDYEDAFFEASTLKYLPADEAKDQTSLVKQHLFARLENRTVPADALLWWITGLGYFIETEREAKRLARSFGNQLLSQHDDVDPNEACMEWWRMADEMESKPEVYMAFADAVDSWFAERLAELPSPEIAEWLRLAHPNFPREQSPVEQEP